MSDRDILLTELRAAVEAYKAQTHGMTLLAQPRPNAAILAPVATAIERCEAFQAVKGQALFNGRLGLEITAAEMSRHLVDEAINYNPDPSADQIEKATSWFLGVLGTRKTKAVFCAAIWGVIVDEETVLPNGARLIPFAALPDSYVKSSIIQRSKTDADALFAWFEPRYHEQPRAAYIQSTADFPYIDANRAAAYDTFDAVLEDAKEYWTVMQAASIGQPLAISHWFGYEDRGLALDEWKMRDLWWLPEISPYVKTFIPLDVAAFRTDIDNYLALPGDVRADLRRSMKRFTLGQCRTEVVDRILDLALAFEIAVSGGEQNLAVHWKVSVRTAQLIGGTIEVRKENRKAIGALYDLRNKATHGSSLASIPEEKQVATIEKSHGIYQKLVRGLLALRAQAAWGDIELGART